MPQGLQTFDGSGNLQFDSAARLARLGYVGAANASGVPNQTWTQVIDPTSGFNLWAVIIPNYAVDLTGATDVNSWQKIYPTVQVDNSTGKIFISAQAINSTTTPTTFSDYAYQNSTLIWGVY